MTDKTEFELELEKIKKNPYTYITSYYESLYPHMGGKVMSILCLLPCSLIIPSLIDSNGNSISPRLNYLLLAPPATAKSSLSKKFENFAYKPFPFEKISESKLNTELAFSGKATIIVSDVARIFKDNDLVKEIENAIGEEGKLSRFTRATGRKEQLVEVVAYLSGTPDNLNGALKDGLLFRVYPHIIYHDFEEHSNILKNVNNSIGRGIGNNYINKEDVIKSFYEKLWHIQEKDTSSELSNIEGYIIKDEFRHRVERDLLPEFTEPFKETNFEFTREIIRFYRILISFAFLNIYNREIIQENGINKLVIEEEDYRVALELSKQEIKTKTVILHALNRLSAMKFRNQQDLRLYAYSQKELYKKAQKDLQTKEKILTAEEKKKLNNIKPLSKEEYQALKTLVTYR